MNESDPPDILKDDVLEDEEQQREDRAEQQQPASLKVNTLEPRILLSATWVDADTAEEIEDATAGDDVFNGDEADNFADGLAGDDQLFGDDGDDALFGSDGDDVLHGGRDNDVLDGGGGNDTLAGGRGNDTFNFTEAQNGDTITVDGGQGTDVIDLSDYGASQVSDNGSTINVDMGGGESFTINYTNVESITTAEGSYSPGELPAENTAPDATDDVVSTNEDTAVTTGNVLENDTDLDGDTLSIDSFTQPAHGSVAYNGDGTFTYSPDADYHGSDSFEYTVTDGNGETATATVDLTVEAVNDAPTVEAGADQTATEGAAVTLSASASDLEGDNLTYAWEQLSGTPVDLAGADSSEPTFVAPYLMQGEELEFQVTVSDGENSVFDRVTVTVDADNDLPVIDAGPDQVVAGGTTVTLDADVSVAPQSMDFNDAAVETYGGSGQDIDVVVSVEDGGDTLRLTGNGWKKIDFPYTVTEDTILEFDFRSGSEGEIHGVGFDNDDQLNADRTFKVHGTQNWGINDHDDYDAAEGEWQHYRIRVGDHFTGDFDQLTFAMDHDVSNPDGESVFSNVRVYEEGQGDPAGESISYSWEQVSGPAVTLSNENTSNPTFETPDGQLYGQDIEFRVTVSDGVHSVIDIVMITVEGNPDDVIVAADDMVVNENEVVTLSVSTETAVGNISLNDTPVESYGGSGQDIDAVVSVEDGGDTLRLTGNGWNKIDFPYSVTEDTILEFDFRSGTEGEIHGIGFDNDDQLNADRTFKVHGTQNWGIDDYDDYDVTQGEWQHYRIRVGDHFTGDFDRLTFAMDHDVSNPDGESVFSSIRVYEQGQTDTSGEGLTYAWQQVSGPSVTLENADTANPTFTAPNLESSEDAVFQVTVSNGVTTATDTMTVSINATNDDPIARTDNYATDEDTAITTGNVLTNDADADSPALSVDSFTQPAHGSVTYNGDGTFSYTPEANYDGTDSFTYTVTDGAGGTDTATVALEIEAVADAPILDVGAVAAGEEGTPIALEIGSSLADVDGSETLLITISGVPGGVVLSAGTDQGDGTWLLEPGDLEGLMLASPLGSAGEFRLTVKATATEANGDSVVATETIDVRVEAIVRTEPEEDGRETDWSDDTDLRVLDPGPDGQGVDDLLKTAEELLQRTLDVEDGEGLALDVVGRIVGNSSHEGLHLPDSDGDAPTTYELKPLTETGADGGEVVEGITPDDRGDTTMAEMRQWHGDESGTDTAPQRAGVSTLLWGLLRGIAGTRNTEDRADGLDPAKSGKRK